MQDTLDKLVYNFSRVAIILPILFVISGISMRVMGYNFSPSSKNIALTQITPSATQSHPFPNIVKDSAAQEPKLDLKGPLICKGTFDKFSAELRIKDFNVRGQFSQDNNNKQILIKGDCLFHWVDQGKTGQRICGISQYIPIINVLSQFDMLNLNTILSLAPHTENPTNLDNSDLQQLTKTCKKEDINDAVFVIPTNVTFIDSKITPSPVTNK